MIFEASQENLRDIAAAVSAAIKREPSVSVLSRIETKVLSAIRRREDALELDAEEAQSMRNALMRRAYDQRDNSEGYDYSDLADRLGRALDEQAIDLEMPLQE
jgi:hypothetical protein